MIDLQVATDGKESKSGCIKVFGLDTMELIVQIDTQRTKMIEFGW